MCFHTYIELSQWHNFVAEEALKKLGKYAIVYKCTKCDDKFTRVVVI